MKLKVQEVKLSFWQLLRLTLRCVLFQSSWNYKQFQGLGWCVVLLSGLKTIYSSEELPTAVKRYLNYFNTNTFLAPAVAASTLALEVEAKNGHKVPMPAPVYAEAVMAPVAAVGDALFWGGLRPFVCCLAVALGALGVWWAPFLLLGLFNLPAFVVRLGGTWVGYRQKADVVALIQRSHLADIALVLKRITVLVLGGVCAILIHNGHLTTTVTMAVSSLVISAVFAAVVCLRKGVPTAVVLLVLILSVTMVEKLLM
jgi:PTS system mannose-specific IID component